MKPLRLARVSSVAATGPRAKAEPDCTQAGAGLWRSPHLLLTLNSPVARGWDLELELVYCLSSVPGRFESPRRRWHAHRKLGEGWPGRGIARALRPFSNRRAGAAITQRPSASSLNLRNPRTCERTNPCRRGLQCTPPCRVRRSRRRRWLIARRGERQRWLTHEGWASGSLLLRERKPFRK